MVNIPIPFNSTDPFTPENNTVDPHGLLQIDLHDLLSGFSYPEGDLVPAFDGFFVVIR